MNRYTQLIMMLCFFSPLINASHGSKALGQRSFTYNEQLIRPAQEASLTATQQQRTQNSNDDDDSHEHQLVRNHHTNCHAALMDLTKRFHKDYGQIIAYIQTTPAQNLNTHDRFGQTAAHRAMGVYWNQEVIQAAIKHINIKAQTTAPDINEGATPAHFIARFLYKSSQAQQSNSTQTADALQCLYQLWEVDKGAHFHLRTKQNSCSVWDLLKQSGHLKKFIESLPDRNQVPMNYMLDCYDRPNPR